MLDTALLVEGGLDGSLPLSENPMKNIQSLHIASKVVVEYLRAGDVMTKPGIRVELLEHVPGVNENNVDAVQGRVMDALQVVGIVTRHVGKAGDVWYELNYERCSALYLPR